MKVQIQTNEVNTLPCLMKNQFGQIVLVTKHNDQKFVTVLANTDNEHSYLGCFETYESDVSDKDYSSLPAGYQLTITN